MATFIQIGTKTGVVLVLAAAVIVWGLIAPASLQATVNAAFETVAELSEGLPLWLG
jgi:hypothetical protein